MRFTLESLQRDRVMRGFRRQEFQRDNPAEPRVFGLVDDTHTTTAQLFEDAVVGNGLTDERFLVGHGTAS